MSSGVRAELSPHLDLYSRPNPATPSILRTVAAGAVLLLGFATVGYAQPPCETSPCETIVFNSLRCQDCIDCGNGAGDTDPGESCFISGGSLTTAAGTGGCQDYAQFNIYENWDTSEANESTQVNIQFVRWASDADFWYFQVETSETAWSQPLYASTHIEVAFSCDAGSRYSLDIRYIPSDAQFGTSWDDLATATILSRRDTNSDVGDEANDGPAVPMASTTEVCDPPDCDGYDDLFDSPPQDSAFARLRNDAATGHSMVEIAVDRLAYATFLNLNPAGAETAADFVPCDIRAWQMQTSSLDAANDFAWNDRNAVGDLNASTWAMDNCGTVHSVPVELQKFEID